MSYKPCHLIFKSHRHAFVLTLTSTAAVKNSYQGPKILVKPALRAYNLLFRHLNTVCIFPGELKRLVSSITVTFNLLCIVTC